MIGTPRRNYFAINYRADAHRRAVDSRGRVREAWQARRCILTDSGMCQASSSADCVCQTNIMAAYALALHNGGVTP